MHPPDPLRLSAELWANFRREVDAGLPFTPAAEWLLGQLRARLVLPPLAPGHALYMTPGRVSVVDRRTSLRMAGWRGVLSRASFEEVGADGRRHLLRAGGDIEAGGFVEQDVNGEVRQVSPRVRGRRSCEWPGCRRPALCSSGNFGNRLVCRVHFGITNGPGWDAETAERELQRMRAALDANAMRGSEAP